MIGIVDYGLGNVRAFANVFRALNVHCVIASRPGQLQDASKVILPGVGAFDQAMTRLQESGLRPALEEVVLSRRRPLLGVCVGMQMLAASSEEGRLPGLGWIDADVVRLSESAGEVPVRVPHMGWNNALPAGKNGVFRGLDGDSRYYFLHSYYMRCRVADDVLALTDYAGKFASAVARQNILGVQFHPEKSHRFGVQLLKNFADL